MLDATLMKKMWPKAPANTIDAIGKTADAVFAANGINTPLRAAHFMAQISHECSNGTIVRENMNYSAERMLQIFGVGKHSARVTPAEAQALAHKPQQIAERVYGLGNPSKARELGNTQPGDGYRFRGNGMLQLTGRGSHARIGGLTGFDIENHPEMLEDPAVSFKVAVVEFVKLNCLPVADADNVELVTRRVNGGTNGLAERKAALLKWKAALGVKATAAAVVRAPTAGYSADVARVQRALAAFGYHEVGDVDGLMGGKTRGAIAAFLNDRGIIGRSAAVDTLLDAEIGRASAEKFMRPVAPARAYATAADLAPKVPAVKQNAAARLWSQLLAVPGVIGSIVVGVVQNIPAAKEAAAPVISVVKENTDFVPGWVYLAGIALVGLAIWRNVNKSDAATVADYQTGRLN